MILRSSSSRIASAWASILPLPLAPCGGHCSTRQHLISSAPQVVTCASGQFHSYPSLMSLFRFFPWVSCRVGRSFKQPPRSLTREAFGEYNCDNLPQPCWMTFSASCRPHRHETGDQSTRHDSSVAQHVIAMLTRSRLLGWPNASPDTQQIMFDPRLLRDCSFHLDVLDAMRTYY
jgi:hypothetical protein